MRELQRYPKISNILLKAAHQSGLLELKLILLAVSKLPQGKDDEFDPLTPIYITKADLVSIGYNPKNVTRDLRIVCNSLRDRSITIPTPLGDKVTGWVYNVLYFKTEVFEELKRKYPESQFDEQFLNQLRLHNLFETLPFVIKSDENLMARLIMHPDVLPFLVQLKNNYTQADLLELAKLTDSVYSLRIFLLMMQFKDTGVLYKRLDDLRKEFVLQEKYPLTSDLRRWVIDTAITEINEKTSWQASYELTKTGRKFTHLELKFKLKKDIKESELPKWKKNGLSDAQIKKLAVFKKEFIDTNYGKIPNNYTGSYDELFEIWAKELKNPNKLDDFLKIQEFLDRKNK